MKLAFLKNSFEIKSEKLKNNNENIEKTEE